MHTSTWLVYKCRVKEDHDPLQKLNLMRVQLHTHLQETIVIPAREHLEMNFLWLQSLISGRIWLPEHHYRYKAT